MHTMTIADVFNFSIYKFFRLEEQYYNLYVTNKKKKT